MSRQQSRRQAASPEEQMMSQMGLFQDPMQQMHGLVQLLNALDQPEQWQQEMDYKIAGQEQAGQQFQQSAQMQGRGLDQREAAQKMQEAQWAKEMGFKNLLADEEKKRFLQKEEGDKQMAMQSGLFGLLERLPSFAGSGVSINPNALIPGLEKLGLGSFLQQAPTATTPSKATNQDQVLQEATLNRLRKEGVIK